MKVKICGITRYGDACMAVEQGADALGFVFARESPRYIAPLHAGKIVAALPPFVTPVGVFVNESRETIERVIHQSGIRCIQLHGDEMPGDVAGFALPVVKAFRVDEGFDGGVLERYRCSAYLLDSCVGDQRGGTGKVFDWRVARELAGRHRIILAGGLSAHNVIEAVRTVRPYAIDINSGVESSPGFKEKDKIREVFRALRSLEE